ncbi:uncharacterized protein LOC129001299 isoform X1 [Macrosteles quadrilineatus]|uniref:uncharacterized protein LOC129001299 isoform X1 n=1 Tax=Macrosteles quadrilineatus TaxID=74068 RepID=UPI0023E0B385|nr:uncharacterized protein LOC129001299 isoform X1 [Macrosteles quadrilineatus]
MSVLCVCACIVALVHAGRAITNQDVVLPPRDSDSAEYTDLPQFQPYNQQLTRQSLSPQQQSQILNDIQQHRFQLTAAQRHLQNLQYDQNHGQQESRPPPIEQSLGLGQQPFLTNAQYLAQLRQQQQHLQPPTQQQRQPHYTPQQVIQQRVPQATSSNPQVAFPQQVPQAFNNPHQQNVPSLPNFSQLPSNTNSNLRTQFQQEYNRLLASQQFTNQLNNQGLNEEIPVFFNQQDVQPQQTYKFEPAPPTIPTKSFKFEPAPEKPTYKFESAPKQTYKFEPAPPKPVQTKPTYKFEPAPTKPPYRFETQPPTFLPTQPTTRHTTYNYLKKKKAALTTTTTPPTTTTYGIPYRLRHKYKSTTESPKPQVSIRPTQLLIKPDRQKLFQQLLEVQQSKLQTSTTPAPKQTPKQNVIEFDSEDALQKHIQQQLQKQGLLDEIKGTIPATSDQIDALPNLDFLSNSNSSSPIFLPNGQNIKIIQVPSKIDPNSKKPTPKIKTIVINQPTTTTTTTTVRPPELLLKELTRGLPRDFEIIRQNQDGGLEELGSVPQTLPQKKVTFVILEEQPDGSLKVQGVRGNENGVNEKGEEVDSIIKKIEKGEIKLPKSTKAEHDHQTYSNSLANATPEESVESPSYVKHSGKPVPSTKYNGFQPTPAPNYFESSTKPTYSTNFAVTKTTSQPFVQSSRSSNSVSSTSNTSPNTYTGPFLYNPSSVQQPVSPQYHTSTSRSPSKTPSFLPTVPSDIAEGSYPTNSVVPTQPTTAPPPLVSTTSQYSQVNFSPQDNFDDPFYKQIFQQNTVYQPNNQFGQTLADAYQPDVINQQVDLTLTTTEPVPIQQVVNQEALPILTTEKTSLVDVLRNQGLYAMSKFLRQSGLDSILNSTGPYTVFVPTDRAFRALLVQLGGPDKAEEKFQENPRLLSGLLLHHVIPGAFPLESLQDEMTGVSLAGTQLRVNSYTTQDEQWNNVKVVTINGAVVLQDKKDMVIPQGVAHAVDRVMFPLPVGDIVQTLQSDRENRFTRFLQLIQDTGLSSTLTGSKILTVFAPVDAAFTESDLKRLEENRAQARALVLRHVTTGSLYTAGMTYYQQRESLDKQKQLTVLKDQGRIKVNAANVISRNIPSTNGVIHAIDSLL